MDIVILQMEKFLLVNEGKKIQFFVSKILCPIGIVASTMLVDDYQQMMDRGWRK